MCVLFLCLCWFLCGLAVRLVVLALLSCLLSVVVRLLHVARFVYFVGNWMCFPFRVAFLSPHHVGDDFESNAARRHRAPARAPSRGLVAWKVLRREAVWLKPAGFLCVRPAQNRALSPNRGVSPNVLQTSKRLPCGCFLGPPIVGPSLKGLWTCKVCGCSSLLGSLSYVETTPFDR